MKLLSLFFMLAAPLETMSPRVVLERPVFFCIKCNKTFVTQDELREHAKESRKCRNTSLNHIALKPVLINITVENK